jgi:hypothetical protein
MSAEPTTWPTADECEAALAALAAASNAVDELHLRTYKLVDGDSLREGAPRPTLADLGALGRLVELARLDASAISSDLDDIARGFSDSVFHVEEASR